MTRQYKAYTDEDILREVENVKSMAQLLKNLGLKPTGGNYDNMKRNLQRLGVTADHWTGKLWSKGERLKDWSQYKTTKAARVHLIRERGGCCEMCGLSEWLDQPMKFEIHHIDGDRTNNNSENLQVLCPNCHSLTDNWKNTRR